MHCICNLTAENGIRKVQGCAADSTGGGNLPRSLDQSYCAGMDSSLTYYL